MENTNFKQSENPLTMFSQIDMGKPGNMPDKVNLFNGQVFFPLDLVSLTNQTEDKTLKISACYSSNVADITNCRNQEKETGILGVGWQMPVEKITLDKSITAFNNEEVYYLHCSNAIYKLLFYKDYGDFIEYHVNIHQLWCVKFYHNLQNPLQQHWEIIKEDGTRYIYGAYLYKNVPNFNNISCQDYRLRWNNWSGTSKMPAEMFSIAWNLTQIIPVWENTTEFFYESTVIPGTAENTGYTRSNRLLKVRCSSGLGVDFHYKPKESYEINLPSVKPEKQNYEIEQFYYEEKFLDRISVNKNEKSLFFLQFNYEFYKKYECSSYCKRYLISVKKILNTGAEIPPHKFYYDTSKDSPLFGALQKVVFPTGATSLYTYEKHSMLSSKMDIELKNPGKDFQSDVYHGDDYEVVVFSDDGSKKISLQVCSWSGMWSVWKDSSLNRKNIKDLKVLTGLGFFVCYFKEPSNEKTKMFIYYRKEGVYGAWKEQEVILDGRIKEITVSVGTDFITYCCNEIRSIYFIDFKTDSKQWIETRKDFFPGQKTFLLAAKNNCLAATYYENNNQIKYQIFYSLGNGEWHLGYSKLMYSKMVLDYTKNFFSFNSCFGTGTYVTEVKNDIIYYHVDRFIIDFDHTIKMFQSQEKQQHIKINSPASYTIVKDSLYCNSSTVHRFNGQYFIANNPVLLEEGKEYIFNAGNDLFICGQKKDGQIEYSAYQYNPYDETWEKTNISCKIRSTDMIIPQIAGNYCTIGNRVYYKESNRIWHKTSLNLPDNVDLITLRLCGNQFLLYEKIDKKNTVFIQYLKDGQFYKEPELLKNQSIKVSDDALQPIAGNYFFASYQGENFSHAKSIILHYADSRINEGYIDCCTVSKCIVDDGFTQCETLYSHNHSKSFYDKYLQTVMLSEVMIKTGKSTGYTKKIFFNQTYQDENYSSYLNGYLKAEEYYDNNHIMVGEMLYKYNVLNQLESQPLQGVCIQMAECLEKNRADEQDASLFLESKKNFEYNIKGQKCKTITYGYDGTGKLTELCDFIQYAWEKYPEMNQYHILDKCALESKFYNKKQIESVGYKYINYSNKCWDTAEKWRCTDQSKKFEFDAEYPDGWVLLEKVMNRSQYGNILSGRNIDGIIYKNIYDKFDYEKICEIKNAEDEDTSGYWGFEEYEPKNNFILHGMVSIVNDECYTGKSSLKLMKTEDASYVEKEAVIGGGVYMLSFFAKTENCSGSDTKVIIRSTNGTSIIEKDIVGNGKWEHYHLLIPQKFDFKNQIHIIFSNNTSIPLWIDDIFMVPFAGGGEAIVYDEKTGLPVSKVNSAGLTERTEYDEYGQTVCYSNGSQLKEIYSGSRYKKDLFPLSDYKIVTIKKGLFDNFASGDVWKEFTTVEGDFSVSGHTLNGSGKLIFEALENSYNFAVTFSLAKKTAAGKDAVLEIDGDTVCLTTKEQGYTHYLLLLNGRNVLVLENGIQMIKFCKDQPIKGRITLNFQSDASLGYIGVINDYSGEASFKNNLDFSIQKQVLNGTACDIMQMLYTETGEIEYETKYTAFENEIFMYHSDYVTSIDENTGIMYGSVNDSNPKEEGYPYTRTVYEKSPFGRKIEKGYPGKEFAYNPQLPSESRNTKKIRYTANLKKYPYSNMPFFRELPEGKYNVIEIMDSSGVKNHQLIGLQGEIIGKCTFLKNNTICSFNLFDYENQTKKIYTPNYFDNSGGKKENINDNDFMIENKFDSWGRLIWQKNPDSKHPWKYDYDDSGKLTYTQDARGFQNNYYGYIKYDELGRKIEEGYEKGQWEERSHECNKEKIILKKFAYDGDDNLSCGSLIWQYSLNEINQDEIYEEYQYNADGQLCQKIEDIAGETFINNYEYDSFGNLVQIQVKDKDTLFFQTKYSYNNLNKLDQISFHSNDLSCCPLKYTYGPGGRIENELLSHGNVRKYEYDSLERLLCIEDSYLNQKISYRKDGKNTNLIQKLSYDFKTLRNRNSFITNYEAFSRYDEFERLASWNVMAGSEQSSVFRYDSNSNLKYQSRDKESFDYEYDKGLNRLKQIKNDSTGSSYKYTYDETGNVISSDFSNLTNIQYDKLSQTALRIQYGENYLDTAYTAVDSKALKRSKKGSTYYIRDENGAVVMEMTKNQQQEKEYTFFIQAYQGIYSVVKNNKCYDVIKDYLGSIRAVVQNGQVCCAYNYGPYGAFLGSVYRKDNQNDIFHYFYTGQELDSETGLYFFKSRIYEQDSGRFLGIDAAYEMPSPYSYCGNNPLKFVDKDGDSFMGFLIGILIATAISAAATAAVSTAVYLATSETATWEGAGKAFGIGLLSGAISGLIAGIGGGLTMLAQYSATIGINASIKITSAAIKAGLVGFTNISMGMVFGAGFGTMSAVASQLASNALSGTPSDYFKIQSIIIGASVGTVMGIASSYFYLNTIKNKSVFKMKWKTTAEGGESKAAKLTFGLNTVSAAAYGIAACSTEITFAKNKPAESQEIKQMERLDKFVAYAQHPAFS